MARLFPRREPIAHSQKLIKTLLVATLLISGCAVTDPNSNGGATGYAPRTCQGRGGHYHQDENGLTCYEAPVQIQALSGRAKTALYSAGALALIVLLFDDKDDNNDDMRT